MNAYPHTLISHEVRELPPIGMIERSLLATARSREVGTVAYIQVGYIGLEQVVLERRKMVVK